MLASLSGVRFPEPLSIMKYAKILAVFGALALAGAGSATLLEGFGAVSGTADVKPAVKIMEVQYNPEDDSSQEYVKVKNFADSEVDLKVSEFVDDAASDSLETFNSSYSTKVASGEIAYITEDESSADVNVSVSTARLSTGDKALGDRGLANSGEKILIKFDGVQTSSVDYSGAECSKSESYQRSSYPGTWSCEPASIGGGN